MKMDRFRDEEKDSYELPSITRPTTTAAAADEIVVAQKQAMENGRTSNHNKHSKEINMLKEVVPTLDIGVIMEILHGNEYDLDRSIDAALALMASLAAEEGKAVLSDMRSFSEDASPRSATQESAVTVNTNTKSSSSSSSSSNNTSSISNATTLLTSSRNNKTSPRASTPTAISSDPDPDASASTTASSSSSRLRRNQSVNRGPPVILSDRFMAVPRFRLVVDQHTDNYTDFTISFRRKNEKLGITIQESDGEIVIHTVHQKSPTEPLLAMEAGIKVGDVLTGINSEYFSPGAEVQDVIDILHLAGMYVTLHFTRRYVSGSDGEIATLSSCHKFATMLLDQAIISKERAGNVSKAVYRLKDRVIQWDSGFITERIELWKLDAGLTSPSHRSHSHHGSGSHGSGMSNSASNSALFSSLGNLGSSVVGGNNVASSSSAVSPYGGSSSAGGGGGGSSSSGRKSDLVVCTRNLRPAISIRLMRAEERNDHVVYVIWVMDVKSGAEWYVRRRFREFYEFRDMLVGIRPAIGRIDFPSKRLNVAEIGAMVSERLELLQKFLRKVSSLVCVNSLHPSTAKVQLALQQFLEVTERLENISILESRHPPILSEKNMVQVFVHSVMQMSCMDKVLSGFIDTFQDNYSFEVIQNNKKWSEADGRKALHSLKEFLDNLQTVLFDALVDDALEIMRKYHKERVGGGMTLGQGSGSGKDRRQGHRNGFRYIDARSSSQVSFSSSSSASSSGSGSGSGGKSHDSSQQAECGVMGDAVEGVTTTSNTQDQDEVLAQCSEDELRSQVRSAVRRQVEIEVYVPCSQNLWVALDKAFLTAEASLRRNILVIAHQPQSFFGIPVQHISPSSWDEVVFLLRDIRSKTLPHDRLEALLIAAKAIPDLFIKEHQGADQPLGADDFLPIFIYVLARAQIPEMLALHDELQALCDRDKRMSETGYYLATLEASLQHIADADVTSDSEVLFPMLNQSMVRSLSDDEDEDDDDHDDQNEVEEEEEKTQQQLSLFKSPTMVPVMTTPTFTTTTTDQSSSSRVFSQSNQQQHHVIPIGSDETEDDDDDEFAVFRVSHDDIDHHKLSSSSSSSSTPSSPLSSSSAVTAAATSAASTLMGLLSDPGTADEHRSHVPPVTATSSSLTASNNNNNNNNTNGSTTTGYSDYMGFEGFHTSNASHPKL